MVYGKIKKNWKGIVFLICSAFILLAYLSYRNASFVEKNFVRFTGVTEFIVKTNFHNNHESYIETVISNSNKGLVLEKFAFRDDLSELRGHVEASFTTENANYQYFVKKSDGNPYGYVLLALEKKGNTFIMYEIYGN
jgi:hypothetical protein